MHKMPNRKGWSTATRRLYLRSPPIVRNKKELSQTSAFVIAGARKKNIEEWSQIIPRVFTHTEVRFECIAGNAINCFRCDIFPRRIAARLNWLKRDA